MAAHLFSESGQMQEVNIPDIFDVLEEGENEGAVKYLLGFGSSGEDEGLVPVVDIPIQSMDPAKVVNVPPSMTSMGMVQGTSSLLQATVSTTSQDGSVSSGEIPAIRKRDTSGAKAIFACDCCGKAFTTKFNLKRHINMHCHKSKEAGVPIQGPPSANQPSKKYVQGRLCRIRENEPGSHKLDSGVPGSDGAQVLTTMGTLGSYQNTNSSSSSSSSNSSDNPTSHISPQFRTLIQTSVPSQASPTPSLNLSPASLPVQPLPEASLQIIQDLNNHSPTAVSSAANVPAQVTTYTVPVTNGPLPSGNLVTSYTLSPNQPIRPISVITSNPLSLSNVVVPTTSNFSLVRNSAASQVLNKPPTTIPLLQTVQQAAKVIQIGNTAVPATFSVCVNVNPSSLQSSGASHDSQVTTVPSNASVIITSSVVPQDLFDNSEPFSPDGILLSSVGAEASPSDEGSKMSKSFLGLSGLNPDHKAAVTKRIEQVPKGWVRKVVLDEDGCHHVLYFNANGKNFSSEEEVTEYFLRLGYSLSPGAFNFEISDARKAGQIHAIQKSNQSRVIITNNNKAMPPKRRLSSVGGVNEDSRDGSEERSSITPEPGRKRKRMDPQQQMQMLFDFLRRYKREDGSELCEPFIRAPKRRTDPEYYDVVADPIDMLRIQQKLKTDEYTDLTELKADFDKLITNAHKFYADDSDEYEAASEVKDLLDKAVIKLEMGEDPVHSLGNREESDDSEGNEMLEELFAMVIQATDPADGNRPLHLAFRLLPSQTRYPEYYKVITDPLDLKLIGAKIRDNVYETLDELEEDLSLVFKNAMHFNEPGSLIYRDAKTLAKLVKTKKYELEVNKVARENRGSRTRRSIVKKFYSTELAELQYEDSESEESEGEDIDYDDPLWALYGHVRYFETPSGVKLGEPFLNLPSKRELPDYYEVISQPMSLNQIRKKLKGNEYSQLSNLAEDLQVMFENCKAYNRPDSRLYKEGVKLQKITNAKLEELQLEEEEDVQAHDESGAPIKTPRSPRDPMRKRMRVLYNTVLNHKRNGVQIISMFMEKPSKKDYPDYYEIISSPMDMNTINEKIKNAQYKSEDDMISDMKQMFTNCRRYNEDGSDIYEDANVLEKVLMAKARDMGLTGRGRKKKSYRASEKIKSLTETLRDHKDSKGRQLSLIFLKLPNPKEFPDYFEVIKNPVDFEKITSKMKQGVYNSLEECLADFVLMFDNACKYNEPDSQIYKDALTLQSLATRTCRTLQDDDNSVPDVQAAVHDILTYIFIAMYNHQDSEDRCFSDSFSELPEYDEIGGKQVRALSMDLIKRRLDQGLYKRLDTFQRDIFAVMERARNLSRTDSQVFEDSVELQTFFIKIRDEACSNGDVLQSRALLYTLKDLNAAVSALKSQKRGTELPEDENSRDVKEEHDQDASTSTVTFNEQDYHVGEFVYVEGPDKSSEPYIYVIENIFTNKEGQQMMYGNQFFRPVETFHVSSRKFLENEVFRSDVHKSVPLSTICGRCMVVPVREYFRSKPEGFEDKDLYVCESRYQSRARSFKKMKMFWNIPDHINMIPRDEPLEPKRVMSVFKERIEKHKEEIEEIDSMVRSLEEELPSNVIWANPDASAQVQENRTYYEQYTIPGPITLRRGDAVYVRSENGKNLIAQIDLMWTGEDGMAYFHGPWFVTPREIPHYSTHTFYKQESFLSTISDSNPLLSVVGRCCVLESKDYIISRPTQYKETDVYICESIYDESKRMIRGSLDEGLKQYEHSEAVQADEVYFFKHPIVVQKEPSPNAPPVVVPNVVGNTTPMKQGVSVMEVDNEDSLDAPPSVASSDTATPTPTPASTKKKAKLQKRNGYQIFSSQLWVRVKAEMGSFADTSREIGVQWKQLNDTERQVYEEKAKRQNEENALKFQMEQEKVEQERRRQEAATVAAAAMQQQQQQQQQRSAAILNGQVPPNQTPASAAAGVGSNAATLPLQQRNGGINVQQVLSTARPTANPTGPIVKPVEPIFHTVPPRPQRLLHSEAYIRYIEGLSSDSQVMSNWEKQLNATKENTKTDEAKLPAHWLADNGEHGTSLDALWALRDFMMTDALGVTKIL
ncbi:protein polybromo-1-like isoform X3 [Tigriopus californicus]|uniref:protein polybromo-1-like isoform X3 n=1 Tax=Tigriopus californicus TaxID=6832 RepID=UPI0027DA3848|nr:protein polybromo-1-like isoform X3 [Tigriopus californicus]